MCVANYTRASRHLIKKNSRVWLKNTPHVAERVETYFYIETKIWWFNILIWMDSFSLIIDFELDDPILLTKWRIHIRQRLIVCWVLRSMEARKKDSWEKNWWKIKRCEKKCVLVREKTVRSKRIIGLSSLNY